MSEVVCNNFKDHQEHVIYKDGVSTGVFCCGFTSNPTYAVIPKRLDPQQAVKVIRTMSELSWIDEQLNQQLNQLTKLQHERIRVVEKLNVLTGCTTDPETIFNGV